MPNPVAHFQILSKAPDDTAAFYTKVFGWTVDANNAMGYRRFNMGTKEGIDGGILQAPQQAPNFVQIFISVDDVKSSIQRGRVAHRAFCASLDAGSPSKNTTVETHRSVRIRSAHVGAPHVVVTCGGVDVS